MNPRLESATRDPALEARLTAVLPQRGIGQPIFAFQQVGSTMDVAGDLALQGTPEGTLVWAHTQGQGRGRLGRVWSSPSGGIYLSIVLHPTRLPTEVPQLSLVAGLSVAQAVQHATGLFPSIRWPNDLLLQGLKVAGLLVEAKGGAVVLGVGVNVTTPLEQLPEGATSLVAAGWRDADPYRLTGALCAQLNAWYDVWTSQGFDPIRSALRPQMGLFGQPVHLRVGTQQFEGTASDIDETGRLLVRLDSGMIRAFEVGEVTLLR